MDQGEPKKFQKMPSSRYQYEELISQTLLLVNHAFACMTPAIFVIFVVFTGSEEHSLFYWVERKDFEIWYFHCFRQDQICLVGDKGTIYQKHVFCDPGYYEARND